MPADLGAPRKEARSFSINDISELLNQMSDKEKGYSLRARSSIRMVDGKQQVVYLLFLRNGNESVFERLDNWWNAETQRTLARQLMCATLAGQSGLAETGQIMNRTLVQEKVLLRARKMARMAPEEMRALFSECVAAQTEINGFQNKLLSIASEDRKIFQELARNLREMPAQESTSRLLRPWMNFNNDEKNPIADILAQAQSHYLHAMLQALIRFNQAVAENRLSSDIDLASVLELIDKRRAMRQCSSQSDTPRPDGMEVAHVVACRDAVNAVLDLCDKLHCAPSPLLPSEARHRGDCKAIVPAPFRPAASPGPVQPPISALPALEASLFQSLWACSAGRSAGAVYMASRALTPVARRMASRATLAAAPAAATTVTTVTTATIRTSAGAPRPILPALSPRDIVCDCQAELDVADIDSQALILIANEGGLFSLSAACQLWLAALGRRQHASETHFARVQDQRQTVLLAQAQRTSMHGHLSAGAIRKLAETYDAAVAQAISQSRPICLTDLFDHDPCTVDQCVEAMLAPIRRCYQEGLQPAIQIRVSSPRLQARIVSALNALVPAPPTNERPEERPAVEVIDCLTDADRRLPGLIMVSADSIDPLHRKLARRHAQQVRAAPPGAAAAAWRVEPRKRLGGETRTHLYFYARPCPLKDGLPDGARIAGEYTALFQAARQHKCSLVTLEVLSETPGQEGGLIAALSAAIMTARATTPALKVRIVTRNEKIRDGIRRCF